MTTLQEGKLHFHFASGWRASKYDDWPFYKKRFQGSLGGGNKAVDIAAQDTQDTLWLIEVKDYRVHRREKRLELALEIAQKAKDSLAGIFAAAKCDAAHEHSEDAQRHMASKRIRIVLHLEQPERSSKLFPRKYDLSNLQEKLKGFVKSVDAHPLVVEIAQSGRFSWSVSSS